MRDLTDRLRHHAQDEETEQFPRLRERVAREKLVELRERVDTAKKLTPTRPHPGAPNNELFHKLVVPAWAWWTGCGTGSPPTRELIGTGASGCPPGVPTAAALTRTGQILMPPDGHPPPCTGITGAQLRGPVWTVRRWRRCPWA